jgi:hypothetical protein
MSGTNFTLGYAMAPDVEKPGRLGSMQDLGSELFPLGNASMHAPQVN